MGFVVMRLFVGRGRLRRKMVECKFSIVMSVFNVERYIEEAIESIIGQSIGFLDNVQIVFVNDGSSDSSGDICKRYRDIYPDNIVYIEKENGGLSSARNVGVKHAMGRFVNFFDPDDRLSKDALKAVWKFFIKNELFVDFVTIPLVYFGAEKGLHPKYKFLGSKNRIISLVREPHNFILSSAASFYKKDVFDAFSFDEGMLGSEDCKFNVDLVRGKMQIGYVCEGEVDYCYRRRFEGGSNVDLAKHDTRAFVSILRLFDDLFEKDSLLAFEKEVIAYELRPRLKNIRQHYFESAGEYEALLSRYSHYIEKLDDDFILNRSKFLESKEKKALFLKMKHESYADMMEKSLVSKNVFDVRVVNVSFDSEEMIIEVIAQNFGYEAFGVVVMDGKGVLRDPFYSKDLNSSFDLKIGEFVIETTHVRKFSLPLEHTGSFKFVYHDSKNETYHPVRRTIVNEKLPFMLKDKGAGIIRGDRRIAFDGRRFFIRQFDGSYVKERFRSVAHIVKRFRVFTPLRLFCGKSRRYVLINDRPEKAGDNGEALFRHVREHGEYRTMPIYFVIKRGTEDYKRLKSIGNVIPFGGLRHKIMFLNARLIYTPHNKRSFYTPFKDSRIKYYSDLFEYRTVWLQHGISMNDISGAANKYATLDEKVVVASFGERNEFLKDRYFFDAEDVCLTGFARFDTLRSESRNLITIAPTWRMDLSGPILPSGFHAMKPGFEESQYCQNYVQLLTHPKLLHLVDHHDYKVQFVLHPGMAGYRESFAAHESSRVRVLTPELTSYNRIFAESKLLVTDYSSTFFDFAYLKKPIILFQFDKDSFFEKHYKRGYFDYETDGFGAVLADVDSVIRKIEQYFENGFKMEDEYIKRVDETFAFIDNDNCKRILESTL